MEINSICVGQKIKVVNCDPVPPNTIQYYDYDQQDGVPFNNADTVNTHTYTQAKRFRISFLPTYENSPVSDSISRAFQVLPLPAPQFEVTTCTQRQVKLTITDKTYDAYMVQFEGRSPQALGRGGSTTHRFVNGLPMKVTVTGRYNGSVCASSAETTVQELALPASPRLARVQVLVPDRSIGRMAFALEQLQPAYIYLIEKQNGAGFSVLDTIKNPANGEMNRVLDQVNALDPAFYRVRVTDACGTTLNTVSNSIYSLPVRIEAGPQHISLSWSSFPAPAQVGSLQVFREGQLVSTLAPGQTTFRDDNISCQNQYCYELVALLADNTRSVSNKPCSSILTLPAPAPPLLHSTFTPDNQVKVSLSVPAGQATGQISFEKGQAGGALSPWQAGADKTVQDKINKGQATCYQAFYQDACGQVSPPSNLTCPILLQVGQPENNAIPLSWTSYSGTSGAVQYVLQRLDAGGAVLASTPVSGNNFVEAFPANTSQKLFYRIQGLLSGQEPTYSNTESVAFEGQAWIPTAFTPNGDHLNDVFEVKGRFIQVTRLQVYDRWGQVIFQSQGQGWDGRINGKQAPVGTYPYLVDWKDENGRTNSRKGLVSLVK
ncbi:MAG: gliding motility-associated C-terminal domain-containing protein [Adhaeribacter sp.]